MYFPSFVSVQTEFFFRSQDAEIADGSSFSSFPVLLASSTNFFHLFVCFSPNPLIPYFFSYL